MAKFGSIGWIDLTVDDASSVRDFYAKVVGWSCDDVDMGGYADFAMAPDPDTDAIAGICHTRGENEGLPASWLIYVTVEDLDAALERVKDGGGEVIQPPRRGSWGALAVFRDPAGAAFALFEPPAES